MTPSVKRARIGAFAAVMSATLWFGGAVVAAAPMEVDAVKSAKSLPGALEVVGVVARRDASAGTFSLVDREEFKKCRSVGCANFLLPVRWSGKLPSISAVVKVTGTVRDNKEGKFLFAASVEAVGK